VRAGATRLGKSSLLRRGADYASFYASASRALAGLVGRADVLMPLTTPPLVGGLAELASHLGVTRKVPVVSVVQDLYPDVAVALGAVREGGLVHRAWAAVGGLQLRAATRVVALSQAMATRLGRYGVPAAHIDVIENWALAELEASAEVVASGQRARLEYGIGERFSVMYSGNMGAGHAFDTLLAAAERLADRGDISFTFVGDGVRRGEIARAAERLPNVRLFPLAAREHLAESLAAGDLHVVTMRDDVAGLIVPSKLYGILAAARPVLAIGPRDADVAELTRRAEAGHAIDNGDVAGAVRAISDLAAAPDRGRALGLRGRAHLLRELSRARALARYEQTLTHATAGPPRVYAFPRGAWLRQVLTRDARAPSPVRSSAP
jgi:glycosyltransferase involved in cell wall biosynthesis